MRNLVKRQEQKWHICEKINTKLIIAPKLL